MTLDSLQISHFPGNILFDMVKPLVSSSYVMDARQQEVATTSLLQEKWNRPIRSYFDLYITSINDISFHDDFIM